MASIEHAVSEKNSLKKDGTTIFSNFNYKWRNFASQKKIGGPWLIYLFSAPFAEMNQKVLRCEINNGSKFVMGKLQGMNKIWNELSENACLILYRRL